MSGPRSITLDYLEADHAASDVSRAAGGTRHQGDVSRMATGDTWQPARVCAWCKEPMYVGARVDARTCSKRCRQAASRFGKGAPRRAAVATPLKFAYADPPYPGMAARYYAEHPDYAGEVDHRQLVDRLVRDYPDGWALSTSAAALPAVLALCPPGVRVAAWVRGERRVPSRGPRTAWEPVIYFGGRGDVTPPQQPRPDALVHGVSVRRTDPARVIGTKPAAFAYWLFDLLGALPGDALDDLYPGSGGIARAWSVYVSRSPGLPLFNHDDGNEGDDE